MSLDVAEGQPVHYPADPTKFSFDREVAAIFTNMAERSIPNFQEAHRAHARMLSAWMKPGAEILDIGASRGDFLKALRDEHPTLYPQLKITAVDNSPDMCSYLKVEHPEAELHQFDIAGTGLMLEIPGSFDVVCVNYVLQFVKQADQVRTLLTIMRKVKPGGVLIIGHKGKHYGQSGTAAHEEYIRFRVNHGYSREEIIAKTKALRASMFPMDHATMVRTLNMHFSEVTETFRFMMFSTLFAVR